MEDALQRSPKCPISRKKSAGFWPSLTIHEKWLFAFTCHDKHIIHSSWIILRITEHKNTLSRFTRNPLTAPLWEESRIIFLSFICNPNTFWYWTTIFLEETLIFSSDAQWQMRQTVEACLRSQGKQVVCHSWISSFDIKTLNNWCIFC